MGWGDCSSGRACSCALYQRRGGNLQRVTIVGLGLIGGSLGLALRQVKAKDAEIVGYDRDHGTAGKAHRAGAVDRTERDLHKAVQGAGIVIIATPVLAIREVMREIAPSLQAGTVVTDTGSAKAPVLKW